MTKKIKKILWFSNRPKTIVIQTHLNIFNFFKTNRINYPHKNTIIILSDNNANLYKARQINAIIIIIIIITLYAYSFQPF